MKFRSALTACTILACTVAQAPAQTSMSPANHYRKVNLAKNTPIVVQTYNAVNSATFHSGERMAYTVSDDVIVDGTIVAKSGDAASGLIEDAQEGRKTHAGTIASVAGPVGIIAGGAANKAASKGANLRVSDTSMR